MRSSRKGAHAGFAASDADEDVHQLEKADDHSLAALSASVAAGPAAAEAACKPCAATLTPS